MTPESNPVIAPAVFEASQFGMLLEALRRQGWIPVGPTRRDGAIVYDEITSPADLPAGWTDRHSPGHYRLEPRGDGAFFGYTVGPHSWKKYVLPPRLRLWHSERHDSGFVVFPESDPAPKFALVGVRACELHALGIQDRVLTQGSHVDVHYAARRRGLFVLAVQCGQAGGTCFCASMGTGPRVEAGYDLVLTELLEGGAHRFLAVAGTAAGEAILNAVTHVAATTADEECAARATARARSQMGRELVTAGLRQALQARYDTPYWDRVAERCLGCANCTLVCPTCFCTDVESTTDLSGERYEHTRAWDSCFNVRFSFMNGGAMRESLASRYRQWLTHKLANWEDQFGTQGCVGCGRCITWCPAGIDITAEAAMAAGTDGRSMAPKGRR